MPTGRVRWFDAARVMASSPVRKARTCSCRLRPYPLASPRCARGPRWSIPWWICRRGPQAMDVRLIASAPSLVKATRPKADDIAAICEDLIKMLDAAGNTLRRHRYPSAADSKKLATLLRAVADQFDVQD